MVDTERAWTIYVIVVGVFVGIVAVASALIVLHRLVSPDAELANIYEWCYEGREIKSSSQLTDFDIERASSLASPGGV
jgi:predicted transcriptional regulator YheO